MFYNHDNSPKNKVDVLGHQHIHGVSKDTQVVLKGGKLCKIQDIELSSVLEDGSIVRGLVFHASNSQQFCELATGIFVHPRTWVLQKDTIYAAPRISETQVKALPSIVCNLITDTSKFTVSNKNGNKFIILDQLEELSEFSNRI
jgi:hypothetical protein